MVGPNPLAFWVKRFYMASFCEATGAVAPSNFIQRRYAQPGGGWSGALRLSNNYPVK